VRLELPAVPGLRVLAPQVREETTSPGDLVGGTKQWEWLVVPERPGQHAIRPFGLHAFDPDRGVYDPVMTPPLSLLAAGNAPGGGDGTEPVPEEDPERTGTSEDDLRFGPVRTESELARASAPISRQWWYGLATAVPPLIWLSILIGAAVRRRLEAREAGNAPRRAVKHARKRLAEAERLAAGGQAREFYAAIAQALKTVLEARLGEPIGGLLHGQLRQHLRDRAMPDELAGRVVDELEGTEFARFSAAGASADEMTHCLDRTQALLERLDRFTPRAGEEVQP
jgi:hypothetical protein